MRLTCFLILLLITPGCDDTPKPKPVVDKTDRKLIYLFGFIYGAVEKVVETSENSFNNDRSTNNLTFYNGGKKVVWEYTNDKNIKSYHELYFDGQFGIDSSLDFEDKKTTVIYYQYPFYQDFVHYSITEGNYHDTITRVIDSAKQSVSFIMDGRVSSTDYFNKEGFLIKRVLSENAHERYVYDELGNITEKYISVPRSNIMNFKFEEFTYVYDSKGNWTKKKLKKMNPNSPGFTITSYRTITYKK